MIDFVIIDSIKIFFVHSFFLEKNYDQSYTQFGFLLINVIEKDERHEKHKSREISLSGAKLNCVALKGLICNFFKRKCLEISFLICQ